MQGRVLVMTEGQNDPRGRRRSDWIKDPLEETSRRIQRAINAWRYDVHDEEDGTPEAPKDGVREHLRGTGEFYPQGAHWKPSPARDKDARPPDYRGPGAARHSRPGRRRRWWRRSR